MILDYQFRENTKSLDLEKNLFNYRKVKHTKIRSISEWVENTIYLPSVSTSESGMARLDRTPYLREILETFRDSRNRKIVLKTSAQVGKTTLLLYLIAWIIQNDPAPILFVQPNLETAQDYSKVRFEPIFQYSPDLRGLLVQEDKSKSKYNTILAKSFPNGQIYFVGSNSKQGLSSRPIRFLFGDELSKCESSMPALAEKRLTTFVNSKIVYASTPELEGECLITQEYENTDKRRFYVKCVKCGHPQILAFHKLVFDKKAYYSSNKDPYALKSYYPCQNEACRYRMTEVDKRKMLIGGFWKAEGEHTTHAGFWINQLYSLFATWNDTVVEFLEALEDKTKLKMRDFTNLVMGEVYKQEAIEIDEIYLYNSREPYRKIPKEVVVLVCGVDVQIDRLEYEIVGYGEKEESWGIEYGILLGSPEEDEVWNKLLRVVLKERPTEDEKWMKIYITCVDAGFMTDRVCLFCKKNLSNSIYPVKGVGGTTRQFQDHPIAHPKKSNRSASNQIVYHVGVNNAKVRIFHSLMIKKGESGCCHFPDKDDEYGRLYFEGLTSEKLIDERHTSGYYYKKWIKHSHTANEPLDIRVYALAGLVLAGYPLSLERRNLYQKSVPIEGYNEEKRSSGDIIF